MVAWRGVVVVPFWDRAWWLAAPRSSTPLAFCLTDSSLLHCGICAAFLYPKGKFYYTYLLSPNFSPSPSPSLSLLPHLVQEDSILSSQHILCIHPSLRDPGFGQLCALCRDRQFLSLPITKGCCCASWDLSVAPACNIFLQWVPYRHRSGEFLHGTGRTFGTGGTHEPFPSLGRQKHMLHALHLAGVELPLPMLLLLLPCPSTTTLLVPFLPPGGMAFSRPSLPALLFSHPSTHFTTMPETSYLFFSVLIAWLHGTTPFCMLPCLCLRCQALPPSLSLYPSFSMCKHFVWLEMEQDMCPGKEACLPWLWLAFACPSPTPPITQCFFPALPPTDFCFQRFLPTHGRDLASPGRGGRPSPSPTPPLPCQGWSLSYNHPAGMHP